MDLSMPIYIKYRPELPADAPLIAAFSSIQILPPTSNLNVAAQIFWLKTRARWREGPAPNPILDTDAEPNSQAVLILPDNGRDPQLTQVLRDAQEKYFAGTPRRQPSERRP
jgi:hypothetical protein